MDKIVNVRATSAVRSVTPPILGTRLNIKMTSGDILNCLCRRALVEEVFSNGTYLKMNLSNYNTFNDPSTGGPSCIVQNEPAPLKRPAAAPPKPEEPAKVLTVTDRVVIDDAVEVVTEEPVAEPETCTEPEPVAEAEAAAEESEEPKPVVEPATAPQTPNTNRGHKDKGHKKK